MSDMRTINSIRYEIAELRGKSAQEAYDYFVQYLDKEDLDYESDVEADYLHYDDGTYRIVRCWDTNRWGLDYVLYSGESYDEDASMSISVCRMREIVNEIVGKLHAVYRSEYVSIVSVTWYDGVEEPVEFNEMM